MMANVIMSSSISVDTELLKGKSIIIIIHFISIALQAKAQSVLQMTN